MAKTNQLSDSVSAPPLILLVEDNIIALRLIETIVLQTGCHFLSATDGEQAFELVKANSIDLVITDIGLPGISGIELTYFIREWEKSIKRENPVPIVGLTAHALSNAENKSMQAGMNKVLSKPIYLNKMLELITQFITKHSAKFNQGSLGKDLPQNEDQLFSLEHFPIFDLNKGLTNIGDEKILKSLLHLMIEKAIPNDLVDIETAYKLGDWLQIEDLAHKIKSGALYCGTTRLQYACQYLERYRKAGHSVFLEKLYQQLIQVLNDTKNNISDWLESQK